MQSVVLIGATDGIGLALARAYLERRWLVGVVGRNPAKLARVGDELRGAYPACDVVTVQCDVTDTRRVGDAFEEALREMGQVDLFVYSAGVHPLQVGSKNGTLETTRAKRARTGADDIFGVNVLGAARWFERAVPYLVGAGRGRIAAIGSVAGDRGRKGTPLYGASKAALHTYLEGLRHRLHGTGVGVTTVKPGWVRTRMLQDHDRPGAIDPEVAAHQIIRGLERGRDVFYVPRWWWAVSRVIRLMPRSLFKRMGPP